MSLSDNIFEFQTIQGSAIKSLFDTLKEILSDTTLIINKNGLEIITLDNTKIVLVHLKLKADKFQSFSYNIPNEYYNLGINIIYLCKIIKTFSSDDILTFFVNRNDVNNLCINVQNIERNTTTTYKIKLMDLNYEKMNIPNATFNSIIKLKSNEFQKIIRDMNNIADTIEIKHIGNKIIFTCDGDFCQQETTIITNSDNIDDETEDENDENIKVDSDVESDEIVQGVFNLNYLAHFTKCTSLSNYVEIYFKNNYPLVIKYSVASLGDIRLCLTPQFIDDDED
jgi:proliferating cell nuclear antigen